MLYNDQFLNNFEIDRIQQITYLDSNFNFPWNFNNNILFHKSFEKEKKVSRFSEEIINILNKYKEHTLASITKVINSTSYLFLMPGQDVSFKYDTQSIVYFANKSNTKLVTIIEGFESETISSVMGRAVLIPTNTECKIVSEDFAVITVIQFEGDEQKFKISERDLIPN